MLQFPQFQVFHAKQKKCVNNKIQKRGDGHYHNKFYATFPNILRFEVFTMVNMNSESSSDVETCSLVPCCLHLHCIRNNNFKLCPVHTVYGGSKLFRSVNC